MAKKLKGNDNIHPALKELQFMKRKELVRAIVMRGMPFEEVMNSDDNEKGNWFYKNYFNDVDKDLLQKYDEWVEADLKSRLNERPDNKYLLHPSLRLTYEPEEEGTEDESKPKKKKIKIVRKKKIEGFNIFQGTKKSLTYELTIKGLPIDEIFQKVVEKFPNAVEKSVKIWHKRALKEAKTVESMRPDIIKKMKDEPEVEKPKKQKVKIVGGKKVEKDRKRKIRIMSRRLRGK